MTKAIAPGATVALLATTGWMTIACQAPEAPAEPRLRPVKSIVVSRDADGRVRTFSGVSRSAQEARLSFKVGGTLQRVAVAVGDTVRPGQLIAALDPSTYELQAQQAQADLARAAAEQRNAEASYERVRGLYANNNASRNELDVARAASESFAAQARAARKALDLARLNVSYTRLTATDACSVASTSAEVGENVAAGEEIALVTCGDRIEVQVSVPENLIAALAPLQPASVTFDSLPGLTLNGVVSEIGVAATGGTTFPVTVVLAEAHEELRSGLAAQVSFEFAGRARPAMTVPPVAIGEDNKGRFVYLLVPTEQAGVARIERRAVSIGELTRSGIEILDGVAAGERIVTAGITVVRDGMRVKAD